MLETIANRLGLTVGLMLLAGAVLTWVSVPRPKAPNFLATGGDTWSLPQLPKREPDPLIKTITGANLWGVVAVAANGPAAPLNTPEWRFVGVFNDGKEPQIMISIDKKPAVSLKVGEALPGGAKILKISADQICVLVNGQKRTLGIYRT
jgi:hypothetical protein